MARKYFGTDGIRGRVGEGVINPEFVLKLGWALGQVLSQGRGGKCLIGKDTRISGYMFESALEAGLAASGMDIYLLGPMPTPGIAYLTRTFHADAGIVISASHNPFEDNGIKFFSADGTKLPDEMEQRIEAQIDQPLTTVGSSKLGKARRIEDAGGRYIEFCKSTIPASMNFRDFKIVIDCANGATYQVAPAVFQELGAEVIAIGSQPDGLNINNNVGSTAPAALQSAVRANQAHLGIALDGDGDRLIMVDEDGHVLDGDELLYIIAKSRQANETMRGDVVGTLMTNLGLEHALRDLGIGLARTKVGDRYIMEHLTEKDWILGGEPSGHIICLDRTSTGDGVIAALQVLAEMYKTGKSLAELRTGVNKYPQKLINVRIEGKVAADIMADARLAQAQADIEKTLADTGRVVLRPSGTEPLIRVMVEGQDASLVTQCAKQLADEVTNIAA